MRILITGVTGYIGSHLARVLLPDYEVYGLVRMPFNATYLADIQDQIQLLTYDGTYEGMASALSASCPDLVYHLAAHYTGGHGAEQTPALVDSNVVLGAYLLEAMAACGCSALVYASTIMRHYQGEPYCPLNLYAATKQAFSDLLTYYTDAGLIRAVTLIISDTYGPGDRRPKILNLVRQAAETEGELALSNGEQDYDVVYIDDVAAAFQQAGEQLIQNQLWKNKMFQVAAQEPLTLRETVETMCRVNNLTLRADWGKRPQPEREIRQAVRLYPPLPGWLPQISLDDGLRRFFQFP